MYSARARAHIFSLTVLVLGLTSSFTSVFAVPIKNNQHLNIILEYNEGRKDPGKSKRAIAKQWAEVCRVFAANLKAGNHVHGLGIFRSFTCLINNVAIKGKKHPANFELRIRDGVHTVTVNLIHALVKDAESGSLEQWQNEAQVSFRSSPRTLEILANANFANLISYSLVNSLPVQLPLAKDDAEGLTISMSDNGKWPMPTPPVKLQLLQLHFNTTAGVWQPVPLGTATLKSETKGTVKEKPPAEEGEKKKGKDKEGDKDKEKPAETGPKTVRNFSYKFDAPLTTAPGSKLSVWARFDGPRAPHFAELAANVSKVADELLGVDASSPEGDEEEKEDLLSTLKGAVPGGYVGLRYGFPLYKDGLFVSKAHTFGLLVEIRSGWFQGLRFMYELTPQIKESYKGEDLTYRSSRGVVGWSMGMNFFSLISRIDLVPKIGQWTFNADVPVEVPGSDEIIVKKFKLDTAISFGIESGMEMSVPWVLLRLWVGFDKALPLLANTGDGSVSSLKFGGDAILDGPAISKLVDIDFLLFAMQESVTITQKDTDSNSDVTVDGISYVMRSAGAGVTISW